jgi:hypothetical protein
MSDSHPKADPTADSEADSGNTTFQLFTFVVANCLGLNFLIFLISKVILRHGWLYKLSVETGFDDAWIFYHRWHGIDSWAPMLSATHFFREHPLLPLYQSVFVEMKIKFQYPLASLLPILLLQKHGMSDENILILLKRISWVAIWLMIATAVTIAIRLQPKNESRQNQVLALAAVMLGSFWFDPNLICFALGQVQILLSLGFAIAFYFWMTGSELRAGAILGLLSLVKPQYGLLLLWTAVRRRWGAFAAGVVFFFGGLACSILVFGLHNNLGYLSVLRILSRQGESFELNQSMNGLLNRLLFNGENLLWRTEPSTIPPFNHYVYAGSLLSTVVLLAFGFLYPWGRERRGGVADFSFMAIVSTIASPVAWEHHYGILLPIFVWLWFSEYSEKTKGWHTALLATAYVLVADRLVFMNLLWNIPVANLLQSYTYFGGLLVLFLLTRTRTSALVHSTMQTEVSIA